MTEKIKLPQFIQQILSGLHDNNHEAYVVGGAVRDMLLGIEPTDWDIATSATPFQIGQEFSESYCENDYGTCTLKPDAGVPEGHNVEITPFRLEYGYEDNRHPGDVAFGASLEEDLSRRDFTINAMAFNGEGLIDKYNGQKDMEAKIIRTVGDPTDRFSEDALRVMRAIRFATRFQFAIEDKTKSAVAKLAKNLKTISAERIRDELTKIVEAPVKPSHGFNLMQETGILKIILPELDDGVGVEQNHHHIYTVFEHNTLSLDFAAEYEYTTAVRFASLFHDIGKPATKEGKGRDSTFYNHDIVGAKQTRDIMKRLKFPKAFGQKVVTLVRYHLFFYDVGVVTDAAIRRLVKKVGKENIQDLLKVRIAERKGSGVPKARPYRLRHMEYMIEKVARDPISVKMLKLNGDYMISDMGFSPGPRMGWILNALLEEVLDDPKKNTKKYLEKRATELEKLSDSELAELADGARNAAKAEEEKALKQIKKKFKVG